MTGSGGGALVAAAAGALLAAALAGCGSQPGAGAPPPVEAAVPGPGVDLGVERLGNASFSGVYDESVRLSAGRYTGPPFAPGAASRPTVRLLEEPVARGDLDGDGVDEAAVLLVESSGGSGTFTYVAVVADRDGALRNLATARVGDRVQVMRLAIEEGRITLDAVVPGPEDPLCCPTRVRRTRYALAAGVLEASAEDLGRVSLDDLAGTRWELISLGADAPRASGAPITAVFSGGRVAGAAPCNRYDAGVSSDSPGALAIAPPAATRVLCRPPRMKDEEAFLSRLERVTRFRFVGGRLGLDYGDGELLFEAATPAPGAS